MDFDLSDEQLLLKETVSRWASNAYPALEAVEASRHRQHGFSATRWQELADLGILALPVSEEDGGIGGGPVETMLVMEEFGRTLAPEPYFSTIVMGSAALRLAGSQDQRDTLLPALVTGEQRIALAHEETQARWDLFDVAATANKTTNGYRLNGFKRNILHGEGASHIIVSARTDGGRRDTAGITLFIVSSDAPGVMLEAYGTQDGGCAAQVTLANVEVQADAVLGEIGRGLSILERVTELSIAALAAEAVGAMEALHGMTVDYLKTRKQFGSTIGSFQSLQHKAADMLLALEQARSMALFAAMMVDAEDIQERKTALSAVKVQINRSARFIGQTAVQLHGGIGMTMEYLGAHHFRRLAVIELMLGDTAHHLSRIAASDGLIPTT